MARAHRLASILSILALLYTLLFTELIPVPFVDANIAEKILPTVCIFVTSFDVHWLVGALPIMFAIGLPGIIIEVASKAQLIPEEHRSLMLIFSFNC